LSADLKAQIRQVRQSVCLVTEYSGSSTLSTGSGFIIDSESGYVLTNEHVISEGCRHILDFPYALPHEKQFKAQIISSGGQAYSDYTMSDWALLKLLGYKPKTIPASLTIGESPQEMEEIVLDEVVTLGFPTAFPLNQPAFRSSIGRVERVHVFPDMRGEQNELIEVTTGIIEHGNSGGPLFDLTKGEVIGINTLASSKTLSLIHVQNFSIAIWPILTKIKSELNQIQNEIDLNRDSLIKKVSTYLQENRIEDAYRCASKLSRDTTERKITEARLALQHNDYDKAGLLFEQIIKTDPRNNIINESHARYLIANRRLDEALAFVNSRLSEDQGWAPGFDIRSEIYLRKMHHEYQELASLLNTFTNIKSDTKKLQEFQKNLEAQQQVIINNITPLWKNALKDIEKALSNANKYGLDEAAINFLRKRFAMLITLGYGPGVKNLPINDARKNLCKYLKNIVYGYDYEAKAALCVIDFWQGSAVSVLRKLSRKDITSSLVISLKLLLWQ
jgi:Trypsin-like peptidase domain